MADESPRCHGPSTSHVAMIPGCQGPSGHRRSSLSRDLGADGAWASSDQGRRDTKATGPASCRRQLGPPSHRPPWSLALMGPSSTRHFDLIDHLGLLARIGPSSPPSQVPIAPSRRRRHGPQSAGRQGVRCILIAEDLVAKRSQSPRMPRCHPYMRTWSHGRLGPRAPRGLMAARNPVVDGRSTGLIHRGTSDEGPRGPGSIGDRWTGNSQVPRSLEHLGPAISLISRRLLSPRRQGPHAVSVPRRPDGLGTSVSRTTGARPAGMTPLDTWVSLGLAIELGPQAIDPPREQRPRAAFGEWAASRPRDQGGHAQAAWTGRSTLEPTSPGGLRQRCIRHVARRFAMIPVSLTDPMDNWVYWYDGSPARALGKIRCE